jgi:NAD(P)-dependent dehydrogenase (short-subunit alcohol dehydrogenase family)
MERSGWHGKTILVTGGTSGLGLELVRLFLSDGCRVIATGRNPGRENYFKENYSFIKVDFGDLENVATIAGRLGEASGRIDLIINNAGVLSPPEFTLTDNGIEYSFQVNFLAHLLLDELIIRRITNSALTFVSVTSPVYKYVKPDFCLPGPGEYRSFKTYAESKFYLLLLGEYLLKKYAVRDLKFIGFDPGTFSSGIYRMQKNWFQKMYYIASPFMRRPVEVATTLAEILTQENIMDGAVYKRWNSFTFPDINSDRAGEFLKECSNIISPYL